MEVIFISTAVSVVAVFLYAFWAQHQVNKKGGCPECGTPVPRFRNPTSLRQAFWGGWTCVECGTEMDRHGDEIME